MKSVELVELGYVRSIVEDNLPCKLNDLGKMIRSKIGLCFFKSLGVKVTKEILDFLVVIELVHNASLFHDDVIDNEDVRRNKQTFKSVYGEKTSVLYGNIALSKALEILLRLGHSELISAFNSCVKKMCLGELLQQEQRGNIPTIEEYLEKTKLKTSSLFEFLMFGISLYSKDKCDIDLELFGSNFGIFFQVSNDLEDYKKGVENSSDIKNGIYTAPVIFANSVKFDNLAIDKTKGLIDNYLRKVKEVFDLLGDNEYKRALIGDIECLMK